MNFKLIALSLSLGLASLGCDRVDTPLPGATISPPPKFKNGDQVKFVIGDTKAIVTSAGTQTGGGRYRVHYFDTVGVYQWTDVEEFEIEKQ